MIRWLYRHAYEVLAPVLVLGFIMLIQQFDDMKKLERATVDWRFKAKTHNPKKSHPDIIIVAIDEESIQDFGNFPWMRTRYAQLLNLLKQLPPKVIGFDIFFTEPSTPAHDQAFADAILEHQNVVTGAMSMPFPPEGLVNPKLDSIGPTQPIKNIRGDRSRLRGTELSKFPIQAIRDSGYFGFVNADPSRVDGMRRHIPLLVKSGEHVFPSLVLNMVMLYKGVTADHLEVELGKYVKLFQGQDTLTIPINEHGELYINYRPQKIFRAIGYSDTFKKLLHKERGEDDWPSHYPKLNDSILLIGQTASGLSDFGPTPLEAMAPLVTVQANSLNNILTQDYLHQVDPLFILIPGLIITWLSLFGIQGRSIVFAAILPLVITTLYVGLAFYLFDFHAIEIPLFWVLFGYLAVNVGSFLKLWFGDYKSRSRIKHMFGTYLSRELVDQMVESGQEPRLGGQRKHITALFSDIESFSSFSEQMSPEDLVMLLHGYFNEMVKILQLNNGTLDKFIGDAIVAFYNAPIAVEHHAYKACVTAIEMQKGLEVLRQQWTQEKKDLPPIVHNMRMRIGLNTGDALVGNMGSDNRFNYTMMGDMVNLAARCESGAKHYGVYILATEEVVFAARACEDTIAVRLLDKIVVKGRLQPVPVYEILGYKNEMTAENMQCLHLYQQGFEHYLKQQWQPAIACFKEAEELEQHRSFAKMTPSKLLKERCIALEKKPQTEGWDGVYHMTEK